jgi:hypothetical protein
MSRVVTNAKANSGRRHHNVGIAWCARTLKNIAANIYGGAATLLTRQGMKADLVGVRSNDRAGQSGLPEPAAVCRRIPLRDRERKADYQIARS